MKLDRIPLDLEESIAILKSGLTPDDVDEIKRPKFNAVQIHSTAGRFIRNEWSLWDKKTPIVQWFKENYNVDHADDISSIILDSLCKDIRGEPRQDKKMATEFVKYWKNNENIRKKYCRTTVGVSS